jgi:hypothetical protein
LVIKVFADISGGVGIVVSPFKINMGLIGLPAIAPLGGVVVISGTTTYVPLVNAVIVSVISFTAIAVIVPVMLSVSEYVIVILYPTSS